MFTEPIIVREASNNDKDFPYCNVALCDFPDPFNVEELSLLNWKPLCSGDKLDPKFHSFYQKEYLRNSTISCVDPISGEIVNADFGYFFPIGWGGIIYKFSGSCTFYLLTSYFEQSKLALFIEEKNTLILSGLCSSLTVELFNAWSSSLNKINPDSIYFNRNPVLFLGFVKNLGHFIWNELSGLESVVNDGLLPKVSEIQLGPYDYLPLQKIFPEFSDYEIKILKYDSLQSSCAFHFPLRVTGNRVSRSLRRRLMSYALSEVGEKWRSVIGENKSKCIWINLRAHNKSWLNQEIHLTNIIQVICFNFGFDVLFILDGTPDSGGIASNLISSMPGKKIIDATNVSIEDSIFLSMGIDFHLSVVGSGLVPRLKNLFREIGNLRCLEVAME